MHKKEFLFVVIFTLSSFPSAYAADLGVFTRYKSFNDYQAEAAQSRNIEQQRIGAETYLLRQQAEAAQQQSQNPSTQAEAKQQIYLEAVNQIDVDCIKQRLQGVYKTREATAKKCTTPQVIKLSQQMKIPNLEYIKEVLAYSEKVARRVDKGELTENEGFNLVNNYTPAN